MKKTITKKVLTLTSTILMTLLMVLGFNGTRVQADTNDTTTQNVVLTKYGFDKGHRLRIIKVVLIVLRLPQPERLMTRGN